VKFQLRLFCLNIFNSTPVRRPNDEREERDASRSCSNDNDDDVYGSSV
jgi:hypothetical protein